MALLKLLILFALWGGCPAQTAANPTNGPLSLGYTLHFVNVSQYPLAVCNDGTPAAYYLYTGENQSASWIVHQQGGWWCWDDWSCRVRWQHFQNHSSDKRTLMSTADLAMLTQQHDTFNGEKNTGLMQHNSSTNPLWSASKVFLVYCSSDSHAGNRSKDESGTWHFRGKEIVKAVLGELASNHALDEAKLFVLTGGSAGGMATINNGDWVGQLMSTIAPRAQYLTMPDSGFFVDVMPGHMCEYPDRYECECAAGPGNGTGHSWMGRGQTLAQQTQAMLTYTNGLVDESCAAYYGQWGAWRCYLGQYAAPFLQTKTLFLQNQIDEWQGFWNGFFSYSTNASHFAYAQWFRDTGQRLLSEAAASNPNVFVFAPNCYHHGLAYDNIFWEVTVDGQTAASMLWGLVNGPLPPQLVMDGCSGLPCSPNTNRERHPDCFVS